MKTIDRSRRNQQSFRFVVSLAVMLLTAASAWAQGSLDGFDPNANGTIRAVVAQPDGKILIGGDFTALAPNGGPTIPRNRLARLNIDGTVDLTFDPNVSNTVYTIAVQSDGKILFGGDFSSVSPNGGLPVVRNRLARVNPDGSLDNAFNPNPVGSVLSIFVQADGKILVGGSFVGPNSIGGQSRNNMARLHPATGAADSFAPNPNGSVFAIAVQRDGKVLAGGFFTSIGNQVRSRLARLDPTTGLADEFAPNPNSSVFAIAVQPDGKIWAGGAFSTIGGESRSNIARLNAAGSADALAPNANGTIYSIALQPDGRVLVGGMFSEISGQTRRSIARLEPTTGAADSFNPGASASSLVYSLAVQQDGKLLAAGTFNSLTPAGGVAIPRNRIARIEQSGRVDQTIGPTIVSDTVFDMAVQPDGKIIIAGSFTSVHGVLRNRIARLNPDGTLDLAFDPNANQAVQSVVLLPDGKILVGGDFSGPNSIGGAARNFIARLDPQTGAADSFNPLPNNSVGGIDVQQDGKILVCGQFTQIGGQARNRIARLDPVTGLADSWNPNADSTLYTVKVENDGNVLAGGFFENIGGQSRKHIARINGITGSAEPFNPQANSFVHAIVVQPDGKVLVAGNFTAVGGQPRRFVARLDTTSGLADAWNPDPNGPVYSIAPQTNGKIFLSGSFATVGGQVRQRIARVASDTGVVDGFNPNADGIVFSMALQSDGKIITGGSFTNIGGQPRSHFARLLNDESAVQNLTVTRDTVVWQRGGASTELVRAMFEFSDDNVNFVSLGEGMRSGSSWAIAGQSFPLGQNFYVRARGFYYGGDRNQSGSIVETTRIAFLPAPPAATAVVSRKVHGFAGNFDINLPLTGAPAVECRSGGGTRDYQIVVTFGVPVTFTGAAVTAGTGSVAETAGNGSTTVILSLTGVASEQTIGVTLAGVSDGNTTGDITVPMGVLIGDTNGDRLVNAGDSLRTRNAAGQATDATNFRVDVNADGFINSGDTLAVRVRSGSSLP